VDLEDDDFNWTDFFRAQKAEMVDGKAIQKIKNEYQHSEQEISDLLAAFEQCEGDMDAVYEEIMCSNVLEDDERFRKIIDDAIDNQNVTAWRKYKKEIAAKKRKRVEKAKKEEIEAREYAEELGVADKLFGKGNARSKKRDDTADLAALIQQRQKGRENAFFDSLEAKYGGGAKKSGKGRKRATLDEPPEEAFEKNRKKGRA
jgi:DnaJ homolog subfamily C member 9